MPVEVEPLERVARIKSTNGVENVGIVGNGNREDAKVMKSTRKTSLQTRRT